MKWGCARVLCLHNRLLALGTAAQLMVDNMDAERAHLSGLRERFLSHVRQIPDTVVHTHPEDHVPGIVNVGFAGVDGETLLLALPGLAVSSGSACTSASVEPSFVCVALEWPMNWPTLRYDSASGVLLSLGMWTPQRSNSPLPSVDCATLKHAYNVRPLRLPKGRFSSVFS